MATESKAVTTPLTTAQWILAQIDAVRKAQAAPKVDRRVTGDRRRVPPSTFDLLQSFMMSVYIETDHAEIIVGWKAILMPAGLSTRSEYNQAVVEKLLKDAEIARREKLSAGAEKSHDT